MEGRITEADLRSRIDQQGGAILDAVVVVRDRPDEPRTFALYVRGSWAEAAWLGVALHRNRGLRIQRTFDPWISFLEERRYARRLAVYREGDPDLAALGIQPGAQAAPPQP